MNVFGVWNKVGGEYHHFLDGRPLCRRPLNPSGVGAPMKADRKNPHSIRAGMCPMCRAANDARWSGDFGPEAGVPLDERPAAG